MPTLQFHHKPNDSVVLTDGILTYQDSAANLILDSDSAYEPLAEGIIEKRYYENGKAQAIAATARGLNTLALSAAETIQIQALLSDIQGLLARQALRLE